MKLSELLDTNNVSFQKAFVLGMIYARPIFLKEGKVLAYSSYKKGSRSTRLVQMLPEQKYYELHKNKLINFLGAGYDVILNNDLNHELDTGKNKIEKGGVSIIISNDIFFSDKVDKNIYLYGLIEKWLIDVEDKFKKVFLIGIFDARGSLDFTAKYISIDLIDTPDIVKRKLSKYNDIIGAVFNYNPRLVQKKSHTKNDQFRLPLNYFIGHFGLLNPFKIDYYKNEKPEYTEGAFLGNKFFFSDLNYINEKIPENFISAVNLKINNLAINLSKENLSDEEKRLIINKWRLENLSIDDDDEIVHSSQNIKELAKRNSDFKCEFDFLHKTCIAKSNKKSYVEAHHLIPFSERSKFNLSIDILENIVSLCPNCHRKIHLAEDSERLDLLGKIFNERSEKLNKAGILINEDDLFGFYKIG